MKHIAPGVCPVCKEELSITSLKCSECGTEIRGEFTSCPFCRLDSEQTEFLTAFLRCRGSIKEMEKMLGVSYPTIKNRLENLLSALKLDKIKSKSHPKRRDILKQITNGELSPDQALDLLE